MIAGAIEDVVDIRYTGEFRFLAFEGENLASVTKEVRLQEKAKAPVKEGDVAGEAVYMLGGKEIGRVPIVYAQTMEQAGYFDYFKKVAARTIL